MRYLSTLSRCALAHLALALATAGLAQTSAQTTAQNPAQPYRIVSRTANTTPTGPDINTVAGTGSSGFVGVGIPAVQAELAQPSRVVVDKSNNFYFSDTANQRVRKVTAAGIISTYAGNGSQGYGGDGEQADSASLNNPTALALDSAGNLYIADSGNGLIRKVTPSGIISTVVGNVNMAQGFSGDKGPATTAQLWNPEGVAVDTKGNIYVADTNNCVIRMVNSKGIIATIAGVAPAPASGQNEGNDGPCFYVTATSNGTRYVDNGGYNGDGPALTALLNLPQGISVDPAGDVYIADTANSLIRVVAASGNLSTAAGSLSVGFGGDGYPADEAELNSPTDVTLDALGDLYIADNKNCAVREVSASTGEINTVAGVGTSCGYGGDAGPAVNAGLYFPSGVAVDALGDIFIADTADNRIREVGAVSPITAMPVISQPSGTYSNPLEVTLSDATPGASIFYTTNGTTPATTAGKGTYLYAGKAIPVDALGVTVINAIATAKGYQASGEATASYTIVVQPYQPVISPPEGTYSFAQTIKIADSSVGATIHYTLDGSVPTPASPVYTVPFIVAGDLTVQAIAVGTDAAVSPLAWNEYVFVGTPTVLAYPATAINTPQATLNAVVNTFGLSGTYYFQYGTGSSAAALKTVTPVKALAASANPVQVSAVLSGLVTKTTYYYQVVVTTRSGTSAGEILSFTTN